MRRRGRRMCRVTVSKMLKQRSLCRDALSPGHRLAVRLKNGVKSEAYRLLPFLPSSVLLLRYVNVGHNFQAELPRCIVDAEGFRVLSPEEKSPPLLWKPWDKLEETTHLQDQGNCHGKTYIYKLTFFKRTSFGELITPNLCSSTLR